VSTQTKRRGVESDHVLPVPEFVKPSDRKESPSERRHADPNGKTVNPTANKDPEAFRHLLPTSCGRRLDRDIQPNIRARRANTNPGKEARPALGRNLGLIFPRCVRRA